MSALTHKSSPSSMDQATAQQLFQNGALLVFLDVPVGTEFGIDYNSWNVGPRFKGVKMIPPGIHFVYYSAVGKDQQVAPRTGFFHNFQRREVLIKKWDRQTEDISDSPIREVEQERVESNREELDRYLGPYPYDSYKKWVSLTSHLRPELLERIQPGNKKICSVALFDSTGSTTASRAKAAAEKMDANDASTKDENNLPEMTVMEGTAIQFTEISKQTYPEGATPQEVTKYSMDHSFVLQELFDTVYKENILDILGELQFAFICFLVGQVYEGFDQWKKLTRLLCMCDESLDRHPGLFDQFITTVHYEVTEIPEDFFVDIVTNNNFLVSVLHAFFENLECSCSNEALKEKGRRFLKHLQKKFNWDFSIEPEEDCPVVVAE